MTWDKSLYPANWRDISRTIRERAGYRCEQCGAEAGEFEREPQTMNDIFTPAETAAQWLALKPVYLDTETTGLGDRDQIVSIAVVDTDGTVLLDTLIRPTIRIPESATAIHGITDAMVADAPKFGEIMPQLARIAWERQMVIYNADYDTRMIAQSTPQSMGQLGYRRPPACAMLLYARYFGDWNDYHGSYRWQKLSAAAYQCGLTFNGSAHGALADADMTRQIVEYMAREAVSNG